MEPLWVALASVRIAVRSRACGHGCPNMSKHLLHPLDLSSSVFLVRSSQWLTPSFFNHWQTSEIPRGLMFPNNDAMMVVSVPCIIAPCCARAVFTPSLHRTLSPHLPHSLVYVAVFSCTLLRDALVRVFFSSQMTDPSFVGRFFGAPHAGYLDAQAQAARRKPSRTRTTVTHARRAPPSRIFLWDTCRVPSQARGDPDVR